MPAVKAKAPVTGVLVSSLWLEGEASASIPVNNTISVQRGMVRRSYLDRTILEGTCIQLTEVSDGRGFCILRMGSFWEVAGYHLSSLPTYYMHPHPPLAQFLLDFLVQSRPQRDTQGDGVSSTRAVTIKGLEFLSLILAPGTKRSCPSPPPQTHSSLPVYQPDGRPQAMTHLCENHPSGCLLCLISALSKHLAVDSHSRFFDRWGNEAGRILSLLRSPAQNLGLPQAMLSPEVWY